MNDKAKCDRCGDVLTERDRDDRPAGDNTPGFKVNCDTCKKPLILCEDCWNNSDDCNDCECDCVLDPEDGSTIIACDLHPRGGSPRSIAWANDRRGKA